MRLHSIVLLGAAIALCACHSKKAPRVLGPTPSGMVAIAAGRYQEGGMMSQNTLVDVEAFFLDETEVTVAAYAACVNAGRCNADHVNEAQAGSAPAPDAACNFRVSGRENHPMNCVDWSQADAYCRAQGKRLPTDLEWEWAARSSGGTGPRGLNAQGQSPWDGVPPAFQPCWSQKAPRTGTCPVGTNPAGDRGGLEDLAGNVSEWTTSDQGSKAGASSTAAKKNELLFGCDWQCTQWYQGISSVAARPTRMTVTGFRCAQ